jgi:hypothetical protein
MDMILLTYFAGFISYLLLCVVRHKGFWNTYLVYKFVKGVQVFAFGSPRVESIIAMSMGEN